MGGVRRHRGEEGRRREGGGVGELKKNCYQRAPRRNEPVRLKTTISNERFRLKGDMAVVKILIK
jgi:hypothetical protein